MLFHFDFLNAKGIYNLHVDVLAFFEKSITRRRYVDELFTVSLKNVITDSNTLDAKFKSVFIELNKPGINKQFVYNTLVNNNNVIQLLSNTGYTLISFPSPAYDLLLGKISALYLFLWSSTITTNTCTANYGSLTQHYIDHDTSNLLRTRRICPFCGLRRLENPRDKRNEYDHYLDKATYPYLAVNFINLVPMCDTCNHRPNKGTKNIIFNDVGGRQLVYYPYSPVDSFSVALSCTDLFMPSAKWTVTTNSIPINRGFTAWKTVFRIDKRYENHITDEYAFWIGSFAKYYKGDLPSNVADLKAKIASYVSDVLSAFDSDVGYFLHFEFWNYFAGIPDADLELIIDLMTAREIFVSTELDGSIENRLGILNRPNPKLAHACRVCPVCKSQSHCKTPTP